MNYALPALTQHTLTLLDEPLVGHQDVLGVHHDDLAVARAHGEVVEADIQQVEGELKVVVGELLGDVHQLPRQVHALLPRRVVVAPQLLAHVVDGHHAAARPQVLGERPAFVRREALEGNRQTFCLLKIRDDAVFFKRQKLNQWGDRGGKKSSYGI